MIKRSIVAVATPFGKGAIGIVRLSGGEEIYDVVRNCFRRRRDGWSMTDLTHRKVYILDLVDPEEGKIVDETTVVFYKSPNSYTGENVLEIFCHNSSYILQKTISIMLRYDIDLAKPGEFTKRAFLNNKMDLTAAESVSDLIESSSKSEHEIAIKSLLGHFYTYLETIEKTLFDILVEIESEIDFSEDNDSIKINTKSWQSGASKMLIDIERLIDSFAMGDKILSGYSISIVGKPNVGKSLLFNKILGFSRSIVTQYPGTTRDYIENWTEIEGLKVRLIDTAGLRDTTEKIENIGIQVSKDIISRSDLVLFILDLSNDMSDEDRDVEKSLLYTNHLRVGNKVDISTLSEIPYTTDINVSALTGENIQVLVSLIAEKLSSDSNANNISDADIVITHVRHKNLLQNVQHTLKGFVQNLNDNVEIDILAEDIRFAIDSINEITGKKIKDNVLNEIFDRFCIGK